MSFADVDIVSLIWSQWASSPAVHVSPAVQQICQQSSRLPSCSLQPVTKALKMPLKLGTTGIRYQRKDPLSVHCLILKHAICPEEFQLRGLLLISSALLFIWSDNLAWWSPPCPRILHGERLDLTREGVQKQLQCVICFLKNVYKLTNWKKYLKDNCYNLICLMDIFSIQLMLFREMLF